MSKRKFHKYVIPLTTISLLLLTNSLSFITPAQAKKARPRPSVVERIKRFFFGTRPGGVARGRKRGGAVRGRGATSGPCRRLKQPLIALVPSTKNGVPFVEQTISQSPTFWFYIPPLPVTQANAEFVLMDEDGKDIYSAIFPLQSKPGIISLQLPSNFTSLETNKNYRWIFSAICNPEDRSADIIVNGWLKHTPVNSKLSRELQLTPEKERISVYTQNRLWYETLTNLAKLREQNPQDETIKADWSTVLQLMDLPENTPHTWTPYTLPAADKTSMTKLGGM
ncbi:MAG: DUF928 domain-containing protein [Cyanobacteria bacterium P01_A01_bin.84]